MALLRTRLRLWGAGAVCLAGLAALLAPVSHGSAGWTLRVATAVYFTAGACPLASPTCTSLDPARSVLSPFGNLAAQDLCATLYRYPDLGGRRGEKLEPEVAARPPRVSDHGRVYTFILRKGFRFNTGARVRAANFAAAINRDLNPQINSPAVPYLSDVVGVAGVIGGGATKAAGVTARGMKLTIRLTHRPSDLLPRLTMRPFCAIPTNTPVDPQVPIPSAGPYYVSHLDKNALVLGRNPSYGGNRLRGPAKIVWKLNQPFDSILGEVVRGDADDGIISPLATSQAAKAYPSQFHLAPGGTGVACLALNTSRPLFRNNPQLRRAVNYALNRRALAHEWFGFVSGPTDQYLPSGMPGFRDKRIYPTFPKLRKAKALAKGHLRGGTAIMYASNPSSTALARAQIVKEDLSKIGLNVQISSTGIRGSAGNRDEPFDIVDSGCPFPAPYLDPYPLLNLGFDGSRIQQNNNSDVSYFDNPRFNRLLEQAGSLQGRARYRAYAKIDDELASKAAPAVAYANFDYWAFVSKRIGCVRLNPLTGLVYGALCLKHSG